MTHDEILDRAVVRIAPLLDGGLGWYAFLLGLLGRVNFLED